MVAKYRSRLKALRGILPDIVEPEELNLPADLWNWTLMVRKLKHQPWSFEDRDYLKQIYLDDVKELDIVKGRQTEITEFSVNWLTFVLSQYPLTIGLYTTDRFSHLREYSNIRLKKWAIQDSELLQKLIPLKDHTMSLVPFNNGSIMLLHSAFHGFEEARSIPVDFAVVDERQASSKEDLEVLRASLSHSKFGWLRTIGTGDIEGSNWEKDYKTGTQYEWKNNQWVARNPGAKVHSYHIPQQITPWFDPVEAEDKKKRNYRAYVTEVVGGWYRGAKKPIVEAEVRKLFDKNYRILTPKEAAMIKGWTTMGIDLGGGEKAFTVPWISKILDENIPISQLIYTTRITERSTEKQGDMLINLINTYNVDQVVVDAGGGVRQVEKLEDAFGWRCTKCRYMTRPENPIEQNQLDSDNVLKVDRTWLLETQIDRITRPWPGPKPQNRIILPGFNIDDLEWIIDDYTAIEAIETKLSSGRSYTKYDNPLLPDDALHATGYDYLAWWLKKNKSEFTGEIGSVDTY